MVPTEDPPGVALWISPMGPTWGASKEDDAFVSEENVSAFMSFGDI